MDILTKLLELAGTLANAGIVTYQAIQAANSADEQAALAALDKAIAAYDDLDLASGALRMLIAANKAEALKVLHEKFKADETKPD